MARTRSFLPPPSCSRCHQRPVLGETLFHTGEIWICAGCLTEETSGNSTTEKIATRELQALEAGALSRRVKADGDTENANRTNRESQWHRQAVQAMLDEGRRQASGATVVAGEAISLHTTKLKDTLVNLDVIAIESSHTRVQLLHANKIVALGVDVANTAQAANTHEKLIAHEIALAHQVAMEQASKAQYEHDPIVELKRLQLSARMMTTAQQGALTLQKLRTGGSHNITVQHVHVEAGGQAVVGSIQTGADNAKK